jgi:hypothetical protein
MLLSCVSRFKCSRLRGGVGDRGDNPVVKEFGAGDCVAMTGISPDVDVGVGVVLVECVSPLEPELGPVESALGLVELVRETALFVECWGGTKESREPSRLSALGAAGAK